MTELARIFVINPTIIKKDINKPLIKASLTGFGLLGLSAVLGCVEKISNFWESFFGFLFFSIDLLYSSIFAMAV
ncbi:MAG: hypothetical protein RBG13Loki_1639 [Promethearchaeota archaeon CR_4]|nr:MAG: hypothetical protein RBG13Loki_1639 [Candidatus Lokiarchaeota archaeon CR_4]